MTTKTTATNINIRMIYNITIDNNASDDVASRTRSKMTIKARNERARLDKAQKRSQNIPSRSLTSKDGSIEY